MRRFSGERTTIYNESRKRRRIGIDETGSPYTNEGGHVRFEWRSCSTILVSADHKSFTTIDRRTYQGFLKTLAPQLERTERGSPATKDLAIEWRKGD